MTETKMQLEDWLDDLCVRFIVNLPREELESVERICFQVEEAQWFYEDFIRPLDPALPSLSLKAFALRIFQHCPLMSQWSHYHHITAFSEFLAYKTRVPVRGAIMLNQDMDEVVLVKGWKKGANWSFPRGKINKDEKDLDCAIREVYEETGFDIHDAGLVKDEKDVKFIEITMREQHMRLYVFRGVPRDAHFAPRTRKEISKIEWYKLSELPTLKKSKQQDDGFVVANANKFYMVAPFMHPLRKWIAQQKKFDSKTHAGVKQILQNEGDMSMDEAVHLVKSTITPIQAPAEMAAPSDLPEVTSSQDASSHIKRLLNINNAIPAQDQFLPAPPMQAPGPEAAKSNALLALLRSGSSQDTVPQTAMNESPSPPHAAYPGSLPRSQTYPAPNLFPGLPQQSQYAQQAVNLPQVHPPPQHSFLPPHLSPAPVFPMNPPQQHPLGQELPPITQVDPPVGFQGMPQFPPGQTSQPYPERPMQSGSNVFLPTERHAPAPFHRTGDPQFSHQAQPPQIQGATVPPASKLPPPKLTSHSLALLNVFKDENSKTPRGSHATLVSENVTVQERKPSQHQDQLLSLLRRSPAMPAPGPVELSGHPVSPPGKRVLQRPQSTKQSVADTTRALKGEPRTSATLSGPSNMPQVEGIAKHSPRKSSNGPNRKPNRDRQTPPVSSPITILARPQTSKREQSPVPAAQPPRSSPRSSPRLRSNKARNAEPPKPFQPQILRRSDKADLNTTLPVRPKAADDSDQQNRDGSELEAPTKLDRRPSQTPAQKEALLSLFGKQAVSPGSSPSGLDLQAAVVKPSGTSSVASPLSPLNLPVSGESISRHGSPFEVGSQSSNHRGSAPGNKAFLLGFLEGVAKGNK
ncbi:hypothetical protein AWENTII_007921 [Aspergillus wentii]|nr:mRNA-decapping enzyme subunit 2 [Aspergillus wentii]